LSLALLVTGANGQLGTDLLHAVREGGDVFARGLTRKDLDVTDAFGVQDMVMGWSRIVLSDSPDHRLVVVNATAYTAVDAAEADEETAFAVNAAGPALLATACAQVGARLIHVSTDYVFPGDATQPYDVDDETGPRSAYGRTKLAGEQAVREILPDASHVVRTAWVYGASGQNFVKTMARLERERDTVSVVDDQRGSPTWSRDLASGLLELAGSDVAPGTLHATNRGETTWYGFTKAIFEELGADPARVLPTTTDAFPRPAPRPAYSVLSPRSWDEAGLAPLQDWRAALADAFRTSEDAFRG
jgi:dTDP-4-dehydrorhamnose reductase